jgi:hypothetical protein
VAAVAISLAEGTLRFVANPVQAEGSLIFVIVVGQDLDKFMNLANPIELAASNLILA